jgi:hypothetical protein
MRLLKPSTLPLVLLLAGSAQAAATFTSPTPYLQASDNPLAGPFVYSQLENFEDGLANTPGLSASGGVNSGQSVFSDSVDADDGVIDGSGAQGRSWYSAGLNFITFSFSAGVLGTLPTQVGLAFTDIGLRFDAGPLGFDTASLEVFDGLGVSQGSTTFAFGDGTASSATAEDRFVGATFAGGIGSIRVGFVHSTDWEVDHVFYAAAVPEPGTWALWAAGFLGLGAA